MDLHWPGSYCVVVSATDAAAGPEATSDPPIINRDCVTRIANEINETTKYGSCDALQLEAARPPPPVLICFKFEVAQPIR